MCVDPEGELEDMCYSIGGDFLDLGKGGDFGMINPVFTDLSKHNPHAYFKTLKNKAFLIFSSLFINSFIYATIKGRLLSMTDATHERDVMERLELKIRPLIKELRYYFTGHTTLSINSDFIAKSVGCCVIIIVPVLYFLLRL